MKRAKLPPIGLVPVEVIGPPKVTPRKTVTVTLKTCGNCSWSTFPLTPTGRIRRGEPGRCALALKIVEAVKSIAIAPCINFREPWEIGIWPDTDAATCTRYSAREGQQ